MAQEPLYCMMERGRDCWIFACYTTLPDLIASNDGDDYVSDSLAPVLALLPVGGRYDCDLGASGVNRFTRVQ